MPIDNTACVLQTEYICCGPGNWQLFSQQTEQDWRYDIPFRNIWTGYDQSGQNWRGREGVGWGWRRRELYPLWYDLGLSWYFQLPFRYRALVGPWRSCLPAHSDTDKSPCPLNGSTFNATAIHMHIIAFVGHIHISDLSVFVIVREQWPQSASLRENGVNYLMKAFILEADVT